MSKNIVIQEGGTPKTMAGVRKISTAEAGGGTCYWVPEDETELTSLTVTEDGTYRASDEGYYGYEEVTVNGIGSVTYNADQGDHIGGVDLEGGDDYIIEKDPQSGDVNVKKVPSEIRINTPPSWLVYNDGENIDFTGLRVDLYDGNGNIFEDETYPNGRIPFNELILDERTADIEKAPSGYTSDLDTAPVLQPIKYGTSLDYEGYNYGPNEYYDRVTADVLVCWQNRSHEYGHGGDGYKFLVASDDPNYTFHWAHRSGSNPGFEEDVELNASFTHGGETVYYRSESIWNGGGDPDVYPYTIDGVITDSVLSEEYPPEPNRQVAWTVIYGTEQTGKQTIPVKWIRSDGKELETSFEITVNAADTSQNQNEYNEGGWSESSGGEHF